MIDQLLEIKKQKVKTTLSKCKWDDKTLVLTRKGLRYLHTAYIPYRQKERLETFFAFYNKKRVILNEIALFIRKQEGGWQIFWYDDSAQDLKLHPVQMMELQNELDDYLVQIGRSY